jgi:hypothetical protein
MTADKTGSAWRLMDCIGGIEDFFLDEAEGWEAGSNAYARKKTVRYGTLAAAAVFGAALTYWLVRSKKLKIKLA